MISLYIDTSTSDVSIALVKDNVLLEKKINNVLNKHSVYAVSYIKEVLEKSKISKNDIDNIFVVNGPGSFTGIRIGLTIVKTYSYLLEKEVYEVSSLKALALSTEEKKVLSVIKAGSKNYYIGLYDENREEIIKEQFILSSKLKDIIDKYNPYVISNEKISLENFEINKVDLDFVKIIDYYKNTKKYNSFEIKPNYLKLPEALESKK